MSNASVERNIAPEILHEAAREAGYSLEQRDGRYILKGAGRVGSEVYQRKVEEVMANVSDALADKGVWNSPQAHETLETLSHSFRGFDPDSPDNGNYGSESHETKWGFPSLVAGLFGAAAITGVAYGLAKEFAPHLPDLGHLSFTMGASGETGNPPEDNYIEKVVRNPFGEEMIGVSVSKDGALAFSTYSDGVVGIKTFTESKGIKNIDSFEIPKNSTYTKQMDYDLSVARSPQENRNYIEYYYNCLKPIWNDDKIVYTIINNDNTTSIKVYDANIERSSEIIKEPVLVFVHGIKDNKVLISERDFSKSLGTPPINLSLINLDINNPSKNVLRSFDTTVAQFKLSEDKGKIAYAKNSELRSMNSDGTGDNYLSSYGGTLTLSWETPDLLWLSDRENIFSYNISSHKEMKIQTVPDRFTTFERPVASKNHIFLLHSWLSSVDTLYRIDKEGKYGKMLGGGKILDTEVSLDRTTLFFTQNEGIYKINFEKIPNSPPQIFWADLENFNITIKDTNLTAGKNFSTQLTGFFDFDNDPLEFTDDTYLFEIDRKTGWVNFTPLDQQTGDYKITFRISDGKDNLTLGPYGLTITHSPNYRINFRDDFNEAERQGKDGRDKWTVLRGQPKIEHKVYRLTGDAVVAPKVEDKNFNLSMNFLFRGPSDALGVDVLYRDDSHKVNAFLSGQELKPNFWHNLAVSLSDREMNVYVDGLLKPELKKTFNSPQIFGKIKVFNGAQSRNEILLDRVSITSYPLQLDGNYYVSPDWDFQPPLIDYTKVSADAKSGTVSITSKIRDDSGVREAYALIDGEKKRTLTLNGDGVFEGKYQLSDGRHTIQVFASDPEGNTNSGTTEEVGISHEEETPWVLYTGLGLAATAGVIGTGFVLNKRRKSARLSGQFFSAIPAPYVQAPPQQFYQPNYPAFPAGHQQPMVVVRAEPPKAKFEEFGIVVRAQQACFPTNDRPIMTLREFESLPQAAEAFQNLGLSFFSHGDPQNLAWAEKHFEAAARIDAERKQGFLDHLNGFEDKKSIGFSAACVNEECKVPVRLDSDDCWNCGTTLSHESGQQ